MAYQKPVSTSFWTNKKVLKNLSINDKLLFIYFLTNNHIDQIGIYELPICLIAYETCLKETEIRDSLAVLEQQKMIIYCEDTDEIAILNYNKYSLLSGGAVAKKCFNDIEKKVKNKNLLIPIYNNLLKIDNTYVTNDDKIQEKKAILEYAKNKIKECLEHNGLLDNSDDESNNNINEETIEEEIQYDGSSESIIKISKKDMERDPQNRKLYEARIKVCELKERLYSLNYDAYAILGELKYFDIANMILEVDDIYQLNRCASDLENVLSNLDKWQNYYDTISDEY